MVQNVQTVGDLVAADRAGKSGLTIPLRVDSVERTPDHGWWAQLVHCSDVLGTHAKFTIFDDADPDLTEYPFEERSWYEFIEVTPDVYQGTVGIKAKWSRQIRRLPEPPADITSGRVGDTVRNLGDARAIGALDIETITTVPEGDHEPTNPDHQELLCTGVGYRDGPDEEIEATVLFREDASPSAELEAIKAAVSWIHARDVDVLVTISGAWFDLPVLVGRAERLATELGEPARAETVRNGLESFYHADLSSTKNRVLGTGSLEDMADQVGLPATETRWSDYDTGLSPANWRNRQWEMIREDGRNPPSNDLTDPIVYNSDVPHFGRAWLEAREAGNRRREVALHDCLEAYTLADICPLYAIVDNEMTAGQPAFQMVY